MQYFVTVQTVKKKMAQAPTLAVAHSSFHAINKNKGESRHQHAQKNKMAGNSLCGDIVTGAKSKKIIPGD